MSLFRTKNLDHMIRTGQSDTGLKKVLGPLDLTFLGVGAIIGTGIFVLTGTGALTAGPALTLSFVVAALACGFAALCYAEFASTIPVSGSIYTYAYATLGELVAWIIGWDLMLEYGLATSAVSVGWSGYFQSLMAGFGLHLPAAVTAAPGAIPGVQTLFNLPALLIMLIITTVLSLGVRESVRFNNIMVAIKVVVVLLFIVVGARHVQPANWQPFMPFGMSGVFGAAALVFFAFIGFDAVTAAAEEVRNPERDLPIGIIGSLGVCTILYVVVAAIMTGIVPYTKFAGVDHPVSLALQMGGETWVAGFVDLGAIIGMTTVILVMGYGQTRVIFAMSRDGLLPKRLSRIHPRYATPFFNTWLVGIVFALIAAFVPLNVLAELINIGTLAAFSLIAIAVLVLRRKRPDLPRGFRCPGVPFVPAAAIVLCVFLMSQLQALTWIAFVVWMVIGLLVYFGYARSRSLLHAPDRAAVPGSEAAH
ncbi:amino acid permease [Ralstonia pseudosolanacearum]|uniref:amino acid permease n=1 Tax=Ralstonia pseudosolanacearum TaxID=1310165 RepID=UPI0023D9D302|nr:amino acid permease [Ralstonia pseudosolanacearum]